MKDYKDMSTEQQEKWKKYAKKYTKEKYKRYLVSLRKDEDKELIEYLDSLGGAGEIKRILKMFVKNHKN